MVYAGIPLKFRFIFNTLLLLDISIFVFLIILMNPATFLQLIPTIGLKSNITLAFFISTGILYVLSKDYLVRYIEKEDESNA